MPKKFTKEEYELKLKEINPNLAIEGDYNGLNIKTLMSCKVCGHKWNSKPGYFIRTNKTCGCPVCSGTKETKESFNKKLEPYNVELVGEYKSRGKVKLECKKCGNIWEEHTRNIFLFKNKVFNEICPQCLLKVKRKDPETFKEQFYQIFPSDYKLLSEYVNSSTKVHVLHEKCNTSYYVRPTDILRKKPRRCPKCYGTPKKTTAEFKEDVKKISDDFEVISEYKTKKENILMYHKVCKQQFYVTPNNFLNKPHCPICSLKKKSLGEEKIEEILKSKDVEYIREFSFDSLEKTYKSSYKFDFYLPQYNSVIEFDGIQHFKEIKFFKSNLKRNRENDLKKTNFITDSGLSILRISYEEEKQLKKILDIFLSKDLEGLRNFKILYKNNSYSINENSYYSLS